MRIETTKVAEEKLACNAEHQRKQYDRRVNKKKRFGILDLFDCYAEQNAFHEKAVNKMPTHLSPKMLSQTNNINA